jgi:hypothetical protein
MSHFSLPKHPAWSKGPFLTGKAAGFAGVVMRTAQGWIARQIIIPGVETGERSGHKHQMSALNCVEIGIVKSLSETGLSLKFVGDVMAWLREDNRLRTMMTHNNVYLFLKPDRKTENAFTYCYDHKKEFNTSEWHAFSNPVDCEKTVVLNVTMIAKKVLDNIV